MMVFLMIIIGLLAIIINHFDKNHPGIKKHCDLHKWIYKDDGENNRYIICENCRYLPETGGYGI